MRRALAPLLVAAIALLGSLASTLFLFAAAERALDDVLQERLRGAGESSALLLQGHGSTETLQRLMRVNALDGASLLDPSLRLVADAGGRAGARADLLRVDPGAVARAFEGFSTVGPGYRVGGLEITTGYFPVRAAAGGVDSVLVLEGGESFLAARRDLSHARTAAILLSCAVALALGIVAARWTQLERARQQADAQAARGTLITRMAAMVAHEIRNPLGVIRAVVELMQEKAGSGIPAWQADDLRDVLGEVDRMRRLTDDFLALGSPNRTLALAQVSLPALLEASARGVESRFRDVRVRRLFGELPPVSGDAVRLQQVFANLLGNAAEAIGQGDIELSAEATGAAVRIRVHDGGPGVPKAVREKLFDPFVTTKAGGTGLGLGIAQMLVQQHGGTLNLAEDGRPGTTFEVHLPVRTE